MPLMLSKTYEALLAAGAPEDKARAAAEEIAVYETRFGKIDSDLAILKWMVAGLYGMLTLAGAPSVWLLLRVAVKVGALSL
jgi:hypothetical protein